MVAKQLVINLVTQAYDIVSLSYNFNIKNLKNFIKSSQTPRHQFSDAYDIVPII